jgi:hypothetical protein
MVRGSCLCGAVRYEASAPLEEIHHCHCSRCRKAHGAAFATYARAASDTFRFTSGEDRVQRYRSSPPVERVFCGACGSSLLFLFEGFPEAVWIAAGTFDDDPGLRPHAHIFVGSKAPWSEISDGLPRHDGYPPES